MSFHNDMYMIADELRSIANSGAHYAENDYDRARYARALSLSARIVAAIEQRSEDDVMAEYEEGPSRYTPFVGAEAAVFRDGRMLLNHGKVPFYGSRVDNIASRRTAHSAGFYPSWVAVYTTDE